ncbi:hypothetical protein COT72_01560 [archaeon CG10_big_fil_rev_8_21_14_0_10_43_11]|nr:MAG: hypothetical protein COT72_01560 [archaeon CG10_big_fil_rev_8_21_14_0_10_43_11]
MKLSVRPKDETYFLANRHVFFHRGANAKFENKWHGLWVGDYKVFDSFSYEIRVDGKTIDLLEHATNFSYHGSKSVHAYGISGLHVEEICFIPQKVPALVSVLSLKNDSNKDIHVQVVLRAHVNHRAREINWHNTEYKTLFEKHGEYVSVKSSNERYALFGSKKGFTVSFSNQGVFNEYVDGKDKQRTFMPGDYVVNVPIKAGERVKVPFFFGATTRGLKDMLVSFIDLRDYYEKRFQEVSRHFKHVSDSFEVVITPEIEELVAWSTINLELLKHDSHLFAGLPWFSQYWGRDTLWSLNAFLHVGAFDFVKRILKHYLSVLAKGNAEVPAGTVPNVEYLSGERDYNSLDATPLLVLAVGEYVKHTGDVTFLKEHSNALAHISRWFESLDEKGFLRPFNTKNTTWMDTLGRTKAIEVQALYVSAARSLGELHDILGSSELSHFFNERAKTALGVIESYWLADKGYFKDTSENASLTPNQLVPIMLGLVEPTRANKVLSRMLESDMLGEWGVRSLSQKEEGFFADAYHQGSAWGLTNAWLVCALLSQSRVSDAVSMLRRIHKDLSTAAIGCISETYSGEPQKPSGCSLQLWSSALIIRAIDEFMFGIKPNLAKKVVTLSPAMVKGVLKRHDKLLHDTFMDVRLEGHANRVVMELAFSKQPDFDIVLDLRGINATRIVANGVTLDGERFTPRDENVIEVFF